MTINNNDGQKKSPSPVSIRFTLEERKMLDEAAGDRTISSYFRWLAFKDKIPLIRT